MPNFKKELLIQTGVFLAVVLVLGGGIWFFYLAINENLGKVSLGKSLITARQQDLKALAQLRMEADQASALTPQLQASLPSKDNLFNFPKKLEQLAKSRGLQFGFSFGTEVTGAGNSPNYVPFQVTTGGDMRAMVSFISDIESSSYIVSISDVDLSGGGTRINGRVFYK